MGDGGRNRSARSISGSPREKGEQEAPHQTQIDAYAEEGNPNSGDGLPEFADSQRARGAATAGAPVVIASEIYTRETPTTILADGGLDERFFTDDLTPEAPDKLNLDNAVKYRAMPESDEKSGVNAHSMFIVLFEDGHNGYLTLGSGLGNPLGGATIGKTLKKRIDPSQLDGDTHLSVPDIHVDDVRQAAVLEDVGPQDTRGANAWWGKHVDKLDAVSFDYDSYLSAVSFKLLCHDQDIFGNILTGSHGKFHPIDFDYATERTAVSWGKLENRLESSHSLYFDTDINIEDIRQRMQTLATATDTDALEQDLAQADHLTTEQSKGVVDTVIAAQQGDFENI